MHTIQRRKNGWVVVFVSPNDLCRDIAICDDAGMAGRVASWLNGGDSGLIQWKAVRMVME